MSMRKCKACGHEHNKHADQRVNSAMKCLATRITHTGFAICPCVGYARKSPSA